jgi:hypothetical protein
MRRRTRGVFAAIIADAQEGTAMDARFYWMIDSKPMRIAMNAAAFGMWFAAAFGLMFFAVKA